MPELQTLLREAAGTHEVPDLRAAHRARRRRTRLRAGVASVVVLAAGAGLVMTVSDGSSKRVDTVASALVDVAPGVERLAIGEPVTHLAIDGNTVWVATGDHLRRLDRGTGALRSKAVPSYLRARRVAVAPDGVWSIGRGVDEYGPEGLISHIDHRRTFRSSGGTTSAPIDLAVGFGSAWITDEKAGLIRATIVDGRLETIDIALGRIGFARDVVVTDDAVWVSTVGEELLQVDPATNRVVARHHWAGRLYRATSGQGIWTTDGGRVVELLPELIDEPLGIRSAVGRTGPTVKGFVSDVLETGAGLWVAQHGRVRLLAVDGSRVGRQLASLALPAGELPELSGAGRTVWISDELGVAEVRRWTVPAR
jgi:hypothetical protein